MPDLGGRLWRRILFLLHRRKNQAELREEIAQHHALKQREFEIRGMSPAQAATAAARAMGNVTVEREKARRVWGFQFLESVWQDLAYALRALVRQPIFSVVAIFGLAGGLGFSAAAFSAYNSMALRGWDVPERDRLVTLYATSVTGERQRRASGFSYDQLQTFATRSQTLSGVFAFERTRPDGTGSITAAPVTATYFDVLRVPMVLGRGFAPEEDRVGAPTAVIVLSHEWWRMQRDSSPDVLGTIERVRGVPFTVIGVAAPGFGGTDFVEMDAWIPLAAMPLVRPKDILSRTVLASSDRCCVQAAGRLAPGVSRKEAAAELTALLAQMMRPGIDTLVRTATLTRFTLIGTAGPTVEVEIVPVFALIFGGVGVVLLLACANVANLLLARAATREREIGIRLALGASRARLVRQLMTESLLLALLAGLPALAVARWLPMWIMSIVGRDAIHLEYTPDARVLVVTFALAVVSCVLFGLVPSLHATRPISIQRARLPLRSVFLSAQVTFCVVLLVAAGLFVRSAQAGRAFDPGYDYENVWEVTVTVPANENELLRSQRLAIDLPEIVAANGLREASYVEHAPLAPGNAFVRILDTDSRQMALRVTPEYFAAMRMTMLSGREFAAGSAGSNEVVINAVLADFLGGAAAVIGRSLVVDSVPRTIVGVVRTARDGFNLRNALSTVYLPFAWTVSPRVLLRGTEDEARRFAQAVRDHDPALGASLRPFSWYVGNSLSGATTAATMAGVLGLLALVLASVGIFGVFSFWVQQRQRDIGIRLALGSSRSRILRLVLGATGRAVGWGLLVGLVAAAGVAMVLRSSLYGLEPLDPITFGGAIAVLLLAALLATLLPAWRATHVDPMESLRAD